MSTGTETETEAPPRRTSLLRKLTLVGLGFAAILLLLSAVVYFVNRGRMVGRLEAAIKELDETDPDWRMDDLMRSRPEIAPGDNSAPRILEIVKSVPKGWPDWKRQEL